MDRETLETLCRTFAARQSSPPQTPAAAAADPVPEILRSFRLAEISAAEMESLLGLVTDEDGDEVRDPSPSLVLDRFDDGLDEPRALVDDFPDFDEVVAAGVVEDDDEDDDLPGRSGEWIIEFRLSSGQPGVRMGSKGIPGR